LNMPWGYCTPGGGAKVLNHYANIDKITFVYQYSF
jgi:hypothetical protein